MIYITVCITLVYTIDSTQEERKAKQNIPMIPLSQTVKPYPAVEAPEKPAGIEPTTTHALPALP
jgi:hypothetical protein